MNKKPCPVCESPYCLYVHDVVGKRSLAKIPQFFCMDCNSFFNFSGYRESSSVLKEDLNYLINKQDHISKLQNQLFQEIQSRTKGLGRVLEIGSGSGLFLKAAQYNDVSAIGYEVNNFAAQYARDVIGVDVRNSILTYSDDIGKFDLAVAIGVFEHVENPRDLMKLMVSFLGTDGYIYINVPFVDREHWKYLLSVDESPLEKSMPDPFYDNDVHVIHFSSKGLVQMGCALGAKSAEYFVSKDVVTHSAGGAYTGILFRF